MLNNISSLSTTDTNPKNNAPICDLNNCLQDTKSISSDHAANQEEDDNYDTKSINATTYLQWDFETNKFIEKTQLTNSASSIKIDVSNTQEEQQQPAHPQQHQANLSSPTSNLITTSRYLHMSSSNSLSQPSSPSLVISKPNMVAQTTQNTPNLNEALNMSPSMLVNSSSSMVSKIKSWLIKKPNYQQQQHVTSSVSTNPADTNDSPIQKNLQVSWFYLDDL
jgi:hypothetical protein